MWNLWVFSYAHYCSKASLAFFSASTRPKLESSSGGATVKNQQEIVRQRQKVTTSSGKLAIFKALPTSVDQNNSFTHFYVPWKIEPHFKKLSSQKFKSVFVKVQWIQFACFNWEMNEGMWFIWGHHCHSQLGTVDLKTNFFALFCTLLRDVCQPTLYRVTPQQLNPMTD